MIIYVIFYVMVKKEPRNIDSNTWLKCIGEMKREQIEYKA